jgi:hypothetical protein
MPRKERRNEEIVHALHQAEGGEKVTGRDICGLHEAWEGASGGSSR